MPDYENMSEEELLGLLQQERSNTRTNHAEDDKPAKQTVTLADGSTIEADSSEELNKLLTAKLQEYRNAEVTPPTVQTPPPGLTKAEKVAWDYKTFQNTYLDDPRNGQDYMETARFGQPVTPLIPAILQAVIAQQQKIQELEQQRFLDTTEGYVPNAANKATIDKIIAERGWQPSYQSYQDAFDIAARRGLVQVKASERDSEPETRRETPRTQGIPPRGNSRSRTNGGPQTAEALTQAAWDMPMDKLQNVLRDAGYLKH